MVVVIPAASTAATARKVSRRTKNSSVRMKLAQKIDIVKRFFYKRDAIYLSRFLEHPAPHSHSVDSYFLVVQLDLGR